MLVTFTNNTTEPIYLSAIECPVMVGYPVTTRRTACQLEMEQVLKEHVQAGRILLSWTLEPGDSAQMGFPSPLPSYTDTSRPLPNTVPALTFIWNSDDNMPNWSDGTNWRTAAGVIT
jgi:hypothetical protein